MGKSAQVILIIVEYNNNSITIIALGGVALEDSFQRTNQIEPGSFRGYINKIQVIIFISHTASMSRHWPLYQIRQTPERVICSWGEEVPMTHYCGECDYVGSKDFFSVVAMGKSIVDRMYHVALYSHYCSNCRKEQFEPDHCVDCTVRQNRTIFHGAGMRCPLSSESKAPPIKSY